MAYESVMTGNQVDNLIIKDHTGKLSKNIPWKTNWAYLSSWLNNNRLILGEKNTSNIEGSSEQSPTFTAVNPFESDEISIKSDLPDVFGAPGFSGLVGRSFNSELNRIVYLRGDESFLEPLHYTLWDTEQQQSLTDFEVIVKPTAFPTWSNDGSKFVLAVSLKEDIYQTWPAYELYSTDLDGNVEQLTHLTDEYPWVYIEDYNWSPDGRYVAFWYSWWNERPGWELQGPRYLGIVDAESDQVDYYCVVGKPHDSGRMPPPIWSPNGENLVIEIPTDGRESRVILINTSQHTAFQIDENLTPEGWMVSR
jgi:hypothetical protein